MTLRKLTTTTLLLFAFGCSSSTNDANDTDGGTAAAPGTTDPNKPPHQSESDSGNANTNSNSATTENSPETCSDGIDNDRDGKTDCSDADCRKPGIPLCSSEANNSACDDGIDNDKDGFVDCADYDCSKNEAVTVCRVWAESTNAQCSDGIDNDQNGYTDCDDYGCSKNSSVTVCNNASGSAGSNGGATPAACKDDFGDSTCSSCTEANCCAQGTACFYTNDACFSFAECMAACQGPESACSSTCRSMYPSGESDFLRLRECLQSDCSSAC